MTLSFANLKKLRQPLKKEYIDFVIKTDQKVTDYVENVNQTVGVQRRISKNMLSDMRQQFDNAVKATDGSMKINSEQVLNTHDLKSIRKGSLKKK